MDELEAFTGCRLYKRQAALLDPILAALRELRERLDALAVPASLLEIPPLDLPERQFPESSDEETETEDEAHPLVGGFSVVPEPEASAPVDIHARLDEREKTLRKRLRSKEMEGPNADRAARVARAARALASPQRGEAEPGTREALREAAEGSQAPQFRINLYV